MIGNTEIKKPKDDGKISYVTVGEIELAGLKAIEKEKNGEPKPEKDGSYTKVVEAILVADDVQAKDFLIALQNMGMNTDQPATCFDPLFTVGNSTDYRALILEGAPAEVEARAEHLEKNKLLCDLTTVKEEDLANMIFTTLNVIDTGHISGTVIEDDDAIAVTAASAVASILKGEAPQENVYAIPYSTYSKPFTNHSPNLSENPVY